MSAYDSLGSAVSARYLSGDGGSNRLGASSKMQAPVVQLLKDPLVMLTSGSPWQKTGEGSIAVGSINTNSSYIPYGLGRSLKFVSSATGGYGSWKQSVTVVKGKTYTFSMYVRADITDAGSGSCRLQVQYYDASGSNRYVHRAAMWPGVAASSEADCW